MGTELAARGVATPLPGWSAHALQDAPDEVLAVHRAYAAAGAQIHTTNTFRTRRRIFADDWERLARKAVRLAREAGGGRVAGSIAPLEDCYRPDLSPAPAVARAEHAELAAVLADAGCDLLLCETFPHVGEALIAVEVAVATGLPTWVSLTAGPNADLLRPEAVAHAGRQAVERGATCVLVNCVPARATLSYVQAMDQADLGVPVGCYANAGAADDEIGWRPTPFGPDRYAELAASWRTAGASVIGGCCGTGPDHVRALAAMK